MSEEKSIPCHLTAAERDVAQMLGDAWNLYLTLPCEHPNERTEFCQAVHACQSIVMSRSAVRAMKELRDSGAGCEQTENPTASA